MSLIVISPSPTVARVTPSLSFVAYCPSTVKLRSPGLVLPALLSPPPLRGPPMEIPPPMFLDLSLSAKSLKVSVPVSSVSSLDFDAMMPPLRSVFSPTVTSTLFLLATSSSLP